jgi:hypothetical protein
MDDARTNPEIDSPGPARARLFEDALVAQYIHELSGHRPNPSRRFHGGAVRPNAECGDDR